MPAYTGSLVGPTQVRHPWRATARTVIQALPAVGATVPLVVTAIEGDHAGLLGPIGVGALALSGMVTRVMAIPAVNNLLTRFGLGAAPAVEAKPEAVPNDAE